MIDLDVELKRMGKGWFILQLALEYGVKTPSSTDYGTKSSMNTRTNTFLYIIRKAILPYLELLFLKKLEKQYIEIN